MLDIFEPVFEVPAACVPAHRSAPLQADTKALGASRFFISPPLRGNPSGGHSATLMHLSHSKRCRSYNLLE
jgi:hypothetical protein